MLPDAGVQKYSAQNWQYMITNIFGEGKKNEIFRIDDVMLMVVVKALLSQKNNFSFWNGNMFNFAQLELVVSWKNC